MKGKFLENLLKESESYGSMERIEELLQSGQSLAPIPVQPLYMALKTRTSTEVAAWLPRLSPEQRQTFLDLDLWSKDQVDPDSFSFWVETYAQCRDDDVRQEFAKSTSFLLFLKARFNIYTFDQEDPQYPDHDNYFLTDDTLLLFEFDEDFPYVGEVRHFIRELYGEMGVEKAYAEIFKIVNEDYLNFEEEEYRIKKERLRDYGMVDYYDSLELETSFPNLDVMKVRLARAAGVTGNLDNVSKNQTLHHGALLPYRGAMDKFQEQLEKIQDEKRLDYLRFNFMRLVNGQISFHQSLRDGSVAMARVGHKVRSLLNLGLDYLLTEFSDKNVLEVFDFQTVYRTGLTLVREVQKPVKKALSAGGFELDGESFLGKYWSDFLDDSFMEPVRVSIEGKSLDMDNYEDWKNWKFRMDQLVGLLPFVISFKTTFDALKADSLLDSSFYLNYDLDDIDFEALILSSFINHYLGLFESKKGSKMGVTRDELRQFTGQYFYQDDGKKNEALDKFQKAFGFETVNGFGDYLDSLIRDHLEGYAFEELPDEEFRHVGGPLILNDLSEAKKH